MSELKIYVSKEDMLECLLAEERKMCASLARLLIKARADEINWDSADNALNKFYKRRSNEIKIKK